MRHRSPAPVAAALAAATALALTACTGGSSPPDPSTLGTVAIPTAPASPMIPTASVGHAQLVTAGDTVLVDLPGGAQALATVSGPSLDTPTAAGAAPATQVTGQLTVTLTARRGSIPVAASAFAVRDELGHPIAVSPDRPAATAAPGAPATLRLTGTFTAGDATITWSTAGQPLATWDFQVELD